MTLRLAVTGASGATGRLVVSEVAAAGHDAIAIGRDRGRLREATIEAAIRTNLAGIRAAFEIVEVLPTIARLGLASTAPHRQPMTQESR
jgi:uncharacterized protein YbjT (DUF2867 family)